MSNKPKIWLSSPHMGGDELSYIHQAFEKNWIAPLGPNVSGFEKDLRDYTGTKAAGVFTSGTASIHLALKLLGVGPGDEVLCQSFTFAATVNPIRYQGAVPVFVDSEEETWNMCPVALEEAILDRIRGESQKSPLERGFRGVSQKIKSKEETTSLRSKSEERHPPQSPLDRGEARLPKAILVVDLYGMPARMDEILAIGEKYGIPVIEDAAEALGSHIQGEKCGSFGKLNVLSFNGNKIITTSGGGALLSDDEEMIDKACFLATQARDDAPHYQHSEIGHNYRMSNILAGIGRGQMRVLDERVKQRRAVHERYFEALGGTWLKLRVREGESGSERASEGERERGSENVPTQNSKLKIQNSSPTGIYFLKEPEGYFSNRWLTTIVVNPEETGGVTREDIRLALAEENIEARPLWKPMHLQPVFQDYDFYTKNGKVSEGSDIENSDSSPSPAHPLTHSLSAWLFNYGLCLPSGSNLSPEDQARVVHTVLKTLKAG